VHIIREAKKNPPAAGFCLSCEATPHHIGADENDARRLGDESYGRVNPPLRSEADRLAIIAALCDGIIDAIATDHAPHSESEKNVPYDNAPNGIIGLETLIPLLYTNLVKTGLASVNDLVNWVSINPRKRFNIPVNEIKVGDTANLTVIDTNLERVYTYDEILSKSKNSPFIGVKMTGFPIITILNGKVVYEANIVKN
jgi:dihydroorotase